MALRKRAQAMRLRRPFLRAMPAFPGVSACLLAGMLACPASGATPEAIAPLRAPGKAEGRIHSYQDDANLYVTSVAGLLEHPISSLFSLRIRSVADWITILAKRPAGDPDPHAGHGGHEHNEADDNPIIADAISGASARIGSGAGTSRELRTAGALGAVFTGSYRSRPVSVSAEIRGSREPDYLSLGGVLAGRISLFRGNTTLSAFAGAGRDEIDPAEPPPGQIGLWPAHQLKLSGGLSAAQILTPRLIVSVGGSAASQTGRMSSPYRNSLVGITYFPENLPGSRLRATAFLQGSLYLGLGTALHLRQGIYGDDWGVAAWIPETALAKEIGGGLLATLKHRFYAQTAADFYLPVYPGRRGYHTGDARLGRLYNQTGALEAEYRIPMRAGRTGPLVLSAEYSFSHLQYPDLYPRTLVSHVFSIGARSEY